MAQDGEHGSRRPPGRDPSTALRVRKRRFATLAGVGPSELEGAVAPLMREMRSLDTFVDEIAKGRPMEKVLRTDRA